MWPVDGRPASRYAAIDWPRPSPFVPFVQEVLFVAFVVKKS